MKKHHLFFIVVAIAAISTVGLFLYSSKSAEAQSTNYTKYVWEALNPLNIPPTADDLKAKLDTEVNKTIDAGHLAPFRTLYGETYTHFSWYRNSDIVYTLSIAYPYVAANTQQKIITYLKSEMQNYPPFVSTQQANYLDPLVGTKREPDSLSNTERQSLPFEYKNRPQLFTLYAIWAYYNATGDKTYIQNNWSNITAFYNVLRNESNSYYSSISGAIGMARLAQAIGNSSANSYAQDAVNGLTAGTNFSNFASNAENAYKFNSGDWTKWARNEMSLGFHFADISPEIARYFSEDGSLSSKVIGNKLDRTTYMGGTYYWPLWWMAQGAGFSRWYGESAYIPPEAKNWYFPLAAWVAKEPLAKLRVYTDQPDALVGDEYYIQNLVTTIQRSGQTCWKNIQTQANTCN